MNLGWVRARNPGCPIFKINSAEFSKENNFLGGGGMPDAGRGCLCVPNARGGGGKVRLV